MIDTPATLPKSSLTRRQAGAAVLALLVLILTACIVIGSLLNLVATDAAQTRAALDYQRATLVAEAGVDYGIMQLRNVILQYRLSTLVSNSDLQAVLNAIPVPAPPPGNYVYQTPAGLTAFKITVNTPIITGTITNGLQQLGVYGTFQLFTVTCGALNTASGVGAVIQDQAQAVSVYVMRYGVFYEEDLEILPGASMTFRGRVHTNGDMYLGGPLSFYDRITCAGNIYCRRKDTSDRPGTVLIANTNGTLVTTATTDGYTYMDCSDPSWVIQALTLWQGQVLSQAHGILPMQAPIAAIDSPHDLIERPLSPTNASYDASTEAEKFSNKAAITIRVYSNGTLSVTDVNSNNLVSSFSNAVLKVSGTNATTKRPLYARDSNGNYTFTKAGILNVTTQAFFDAREQSYMAPVDLYLDQLLLNIPTLYNSTTYSNNQGIIYVTRDDPGVKVGRPCVRLRNGTGILPFMGLTVGSDLPVYIDGSFNTSNGVKPFLVAADAVTMLSKSWQDAQSILSDTVRIPANTTYNLTVMTGNYETEWGVYNGGLENVLRFLENWTGYTVTYRGSLVDMWCSELSTGLWCSTGTALTTNNVTFRYNAPNRDWGYDTLYQSQNPPGMTKVFGMEEIQWSYINWQQAGW